MKKKIERGFMILGLLLLAASAVWYGRKPLEVKTATVQRMDLSDTFEESGDFVGETTLRLASEVSGKVAFVVRENQQVQKGDLLLEVEDSGLNHQKGELEGKLQSLQGQRALASPKLHESQIQLQQLAIQNAQETLSTLSENAENMQSLYDSGAVSKKELEDLLIQKEQARRQVEAEKAKQRLLQEQSQTPAGTKQLYDGQEKALKENLALLQSQEEKQKLFSPVEGIVTWKGMAEGERVLAGQQVLEVTALSPLYLEAWVLTEDAYNLKVGDPVTLRQESGDKDRYGKGILASIHDFAEKKVSPLGLEEKRVRVRIKVTEKGDLEQKLLYSAYVTFVIREEKQALVVPKVALFPLNSEQDALWVVREGKAHIQEVQKGFATTSQVQIVEGLQEADQIIIDPGTPGLKEGKRVKSR